MAVAQCNLGTIHLLLAHLTAHLHGCRVGVR